MATKKRAPVLPFDSEHPAWPAWGSPDWAPMQGPTRLVLLTEGGKARYEASYPEGSWR